ncbi:lysine-specific demethylase REF6-like [Durio zibethinus]|uniref:Lysine-specific demethylase REF6-like n=1 Tax=Durio zibethinus TaxID=66656 RepID=A0A6P5XMM7_DURZI|nr:lysine-specific demethylase REF6-like [Durio zibethinus]
MAGSSLSPEPSQEVFSWLKSLPLAPEYRPTLAEFQDPIAYIFKIEKEASLYGICKIIPPVPAAPKKTAIGNLNRSLLARATANASSDLKLAAPTFTTRQQQIGFCPRKPRPVQKPVWQSGDYYTFQEFEEKAKRFERNYLKRYSKKVSLSALEVETLFWKATVDKPSSVEYANDMPGSAFGPLNSKKSSGAGREAGEGVTVGETPWNMRAVSRAKGSLLRFMKEEIPGVTSPMVYFAMLFSWFAWHAEDHDLHSLSYLHVGAGKTWYGVPRNAAVAFEEVVRVDGYGGEFNPLVTFSTLGEKTTVMSPEVFVLAGIPCCRLVQNAGEFVVTFPRAYHSGFSHGFNFGEAANIATPEWLRVARDAAIRRASINYPPMISHFQLLYDLALELCSRVPMSISAKPKSSRLKDKKKSEGETLVKELFVQNIRQNNDLLHILGKGSSVVLLPKSSSDISLCSDLRAASQLRINHRMSLDFCNYKEVVKSSKDLASDKIMLGGNEEIKGVKGFYSMKGKFAPMYEGNQNSSFSGTDYFCRLPLETLNARMERETAVQGDALSDQRLFSCVTCGILCFACVAILQPTEQAARYLMSADCSFLNDWTVGSGVTRDGFTAAHGDAITSEQNPSTSWTNKGAPNALYDVPIQSVEYKFQMVDRSNQVMEDAVKGGDTSALGLLASIYGNSSDSEEDHVEPNATISGDETNSAKVSPERKFPYNDFGFRPVGTNESHNPSLSRLDSGEEAPVHVINCYSEPGSRRVDIKNRSPQTFDLAVEFETDSLASRRSNGLEDKSRDPITASHANLSYSPATHGTEKMRFSNAIEPMENADIPFAPRSDEDSSRMHVFCLEHAVEVEKQLRKIGGVHVFLLCHPEYPKIEAEAKLVAEELGIDYPRNDILFGDATKDDEQRIQSALDSEDAIPGNGDWAVKLGINLFYSANLSRSTLYSKQMPYNCVIYNAFGRNSPASLPTKWNVYGRRSGKQKKVVAGKWCGKVWMSNQVHPFLAQMDPEEQEQERSFHAWATSNENLERKPENVQKAEITQVAKMFKRKRKTRAEIAPSKKVICIEQEGAVSDDSLDDSSLRQQQRFFRGKQPSLIEKEEAISYDSLEDDSLLQQRNLFRKKRTKFIEKEDAESEDAEDDFTHLQHSRNLRGRLGKYIEEDDAVSCDSLDESSLKRDRRIRGNWQAKFKESRDIVSDDEQDEISHQVHRRIPRGRQMKSFERNDANSYDSRADNSLKQYRRIPKGKQAKFFERDDAMSDDASDYDSQSQLRRIPRAKQMKYMERDDAFSDDSLEDNPQQQQKRIPRSKVAKFTDREDVVSFDSLKSNSHRQHSRVPRSQLTKFIEREDAVSSDSPDDSFLQQLWRIRRSKQTKILDKEDAVSDDSLDGTSLQQFRKTPRSRQRKFIEREDAISYDSLDGNYHQPNRSIRSRKKKAQTQRQIKQETPRNVKQGKRRTTKQVVSQQMKQETPRNWNTKIEQSARQCNSYGEEEIEGGPSSRLRKRVRKPLKESETKPIEKKQARKKKVKNASNVKTLAGHNTAKVRHKEAEYQCDMEGCTMSFGSKQDLVLHKRNICPVKGCGKKFLSHKYLVQHRRVHMDDRPLKCPWKGCKMTFKWAWARTEHIRVHTGARPYVCGEAGCGQTFRFVSDFSRHKRKTGHSAKKGRR